MPTSPAAMLQLPAGDIVRSSKAKKQPRANKRLSLRQATNMMAAVAFARQIGTPLNVHATIHWVGTNVGDDPEGRRFAKVREGFEQVALAAERPRRTNSNMGARAAFRRIG